MRSAVTAREREALTRARELAGRAAGRTSPNPLVGAVVLHRDERVGEGWHEGPGLPHAEVMALRAAGERSRGATVVCTLEPCSHHGRTPPCTDALIAAGVARVVVGCLDPLERGRAQGIALLEAAGIEVVVAKGHDELACRALNHGFITWAVTGLPSVTLKLATSLDGKIATATGESRWITGPAARSLVHVWRAEHDAVMVGIGTALADDPQLTARDVGPDVRQPTRVVIDSKGRLPLDSALVRSAREVPVTVVVASGTTSRQVGALREAGVDVVTAADGERVDLTRALQTLAERDILSVFVEGGAELAGTLVADGLVVRVAWFLAPFLIGGAGAPGAIGGIGLERLADAPRLLDPDVTLVGDDVLVQARLRPLPGS